MVMAGTHKKTFEILQSLPAYGPMYISVTRDGTPYHSEGFVVRFFKSNGDSWVANFGPGATKYNEVLELRNGNRLIVIAGGQGYVIDPEIERPIETFGLAINFAIQIDPDKIIAADNIQVSEISSKGEQWCSPRISWDGIKDIKVENELLSGLSYDAIKNKWIPFAIDLNTKEIQGGCYQQYFTGQKFKQPNRPGK